MEKETNCPDCNGTGVIVSAEHREICTTCLVASPPPLSVDEAAIEDVNLLKRRLEFYRSETAKIRDYVFDDANKCGYPTQSIFEAITDKIDALRAEIADYQARQQPRLTQILQLCDNLPKEANYFGTVDKIKLLCQ